MSTPTSAPSPTEKPVNSLIKEEVPSSPPSESPPSPSATSPPPESTPPPSPPAATPSPPDSPPPAPPASSPPPPSSTSPSPPPPSTPASSPPPATPAAESQPPPSSTSLSPPPPATPASSASPPPPNESPPSPTSVTPSPPTPADAAPSQNSPPTAAALPPPVSSYPPPKAVSSDTPDPPSTFSPNPPRPSSSSDRPMTDSPPKPSSSNDHPSFDAGVIAGIVFGGLIIIILLAVIICLICSRRKRKPQYYMDPGRPPNGGSQYYNQDPGAQWHSGPQQMDQNHKMHPPAGSFMGSSVGGWAGTNNNNSGEFSSGQHPMSTNMGGIGQFSYEDLAAATGGFSPANLLGQGGFGLVHKGILPDGREVAVKSLKSGSGQGEREFQAEVEIISRVHHRHLVSLVGYCIANQNKLLVYEYVPNKTLEFHLHGKGQPVMDWPTRLRIAIGTAKGLAYLHEDCLPRIIHRDIKTANILIDNNFEAMVADFGFAKLTTENHTHVSTRVMGTFGYLAPEYASSGKLSEKSDVFSFGVMLLELITGRQPIDLSGSMMEDSLVDWARPLLSKALEDGNLEQLVDPRLEGKFLHHELAHMAACAAASIRHSARKRPKMSQIVRALEGDSSLDDLNQGVKPGQSGLYNPNGGTQMYDTRAYNADMLKFKKMVMTSEEFNSSEYGTTSEYGLNPSLSVSSDADSTEIMENRTLQIQKT